PCCQLTSVLLCFFLQYLHDKILVRIRLIPRNCLFYLHQELFSRFAWFYMKLSVALLNGLIKAINHTYDNLIIRVEFDMLLLAIRSVSFWGVLGLDLLHKRNRFFFALVQFDSKYKSLFIPLLYREVRHSFYPFFRP